MDKIRQRRDQQPYRRLSEVEAEDYPFRPTNYLYFVLIQENLDSRLNTLPISRYNIARRVRC